MLRDRGGSGRLATPPDPVSFVSLEQPMIRPRSHMRRFNPGAALPPLLAILVTLA
jgi:hypothetical protein